MSVDGLSHSLISPQEWSDAPFVWFEGPVFVNNNNNNSNILSQICFTCPQVELQVNSRLLQNHIVRTTGKVVQLKDLHNIKAVKTADGLNDWQSTLKHLDTLRTNDPGATIEVLTRQEDMGLEIIILQTSASAGTTVHLSCTQGYAQRGCEGGQA